jgi:hypothetical protein
MAIYQQNQVDNRGVSVFAVVQNHTGFGKGAIEIYSKHNQID